MSQECPECDQFKGRRKAICTGQAELSIETINAYRTRWGLQPLPQQIVRPAKAQRERKSREARARHGKGGSCTSCGGTLIDRAKRLAAAAVDFWKDGMRIADSHEQETRYGICTECPIRHGSTCGDCGCIIALKVKARSSSCPRGRWFARGDMQSTVRHLTIHVYPTRQHDGWKWNLRQLQQRWSLFNGQKLLGIASDVQTESAATVVDYARTLGMEFDRVIAVPNKPTIREVATWLPMLEYLNPSRAADNEVVFSCHAKGVRHHTMTDTLTGWTRLMWEVNLDDWRTVENALSSHLMAGAFRRYGNFTTRGNNRWHYSGTFYWWRLAEIGRRNWRKVDQKFFGTESWPGHVCKANETSCLFMDDCGDLYKREYWRDTVWPEWNQRSCANDVVAIASR